eukprot:1636194-Pleurochrysis_carterae.AAC.1
MAWGSRPEALRSTTSFETAKCARKPSAARCSSSARIPRVIVSSSSSSRRAGLPVHEDEQSHSRTALTQTPAR